MADTEKPHLRYVWHSFTYNVENDCRCLAMAISVDGSDCPQIVELPLGAIMQCIPQIMKAAKDG